MPDGSVASLPLAVTSLRIYRGNFFSFKEFGWCIRSKLSVILLFTFSLRSWHNNNHIEHII